MDEVASVCPRGDDPPSTPRRGASSAFISGTITDEGVERLRSRIEAAFAATFDRFAREG
jgi:hypothetical protein